MRQARVRVIFDTSGKRIDRSGAREEYAYDTCAGVGVVFVTHRHNHVSAKSWVVGE